MARTEPKRFSLGLDFGTESARAVLIELSNGDLAAQAVYRYPNGVIDETLPTKQKVKLGPNWALQNPEDYLNTIRKTVPMVLKKSRVKGDQIVGIGIDFTSCTILPTTSGGRPLCTLPAYKHEPHAWVKLWKHHAAQEQANIINRIAIERNERFLERYGGKISSEWMFPKVLQILMEAPHIYQAMDKVIEAGDWVTWQLTGKESRSSCAAGYKAFWSKKDGFPNPDFFKSLHPQMAQVIKQKIGTTFYRPGSPAGKLTPSWARITGLKAGTPIGVPIIDAHSAVWGCGVSETNEMVLCLGTSTCHLLLNDEEKSVKGISGVVEDGIIPDLYGYEAGQAAVGDMFAWYIKNAVPERFTKGKRNPYKSLEREASKIIAGESGLLALDWWNGNRSVLVKSDLSGMLLGCTLQTKPHEIYRSLLESTSMGTLRIIREFEKQGMTIKKLHATGGLAEKSPLLLQIYADVTGREIQVSRSPQICATGAAILGAVAAGKQAGYGSVQEALLKMTRPDRKTFRPDKKNNQIYQMVFKEYCRLHDYFGRGENNVMRKLKEIRTKGVRGS